MKFFLTSCFVMSTSLVSASLTDAVHDKSVQQLFAKVSSKVTAVQKVLNMDGNGNSHARQLSDDACAWSGNTCAPSEAFGREMMSSMIDDCGAFGKMMEQSMNSCSAQTSENACANAIRPNNCTWGEGTIYTPNAAGDACEGTTQGQCSDAQPMGDGMFDFETLCGKTEEQLKAAPACANVPEDDASAGMACVIEECPVLAIFLLAFTCPYVTDENTCVTTSGCIYVEGSCTLDEKKMMEELVPGSCPLKAALEHTVDCPDDLDSNACAAVTGCEYETTHLCAGTYVTTSSECKSSVSADNLSGLENEQVWYTDQAAECAKASDEMTCTGTRLVENPITSDSGVTVFAVGSAVVAGQLLFL